MPYSVAHKQNTRTRIVESARRLFNRSGFADVSIGEIMSDAGLTHGGFYKHFPTKEALYREAVLQFICREQPETWQARYVDPTARGEALCRMIVEAYLSGDHYNDRDASCPMIALPSDVSHGGDAVKGAFREVLEMMAGAFEANLPADSSTPREQALATVALCVGGMVLARAVDNPRLAGELRAATRKRVFSSAGWDLEPAQAAE